MRDFANEAEGRVIRTASSRLDKEKLLELMSKAPKDEVLQIFDPDSVVSRVHILGAYINALNAFDEGTNISSSMGMEMLLFSSMTRQISEAIKRSGAKSNKGFVVFANSRKAYSRISPHLQNESEFRPTQKNASERAKRLGIEQEKDLDKFVLQRMAVSRIED